MLDANLLARQQYDVNRQLSRGILFSILWFSGIGSLYSFILGIRALGAIRGSNYRLRGRYRAWWCIVTGGLGTIFLLSIVAAIVLYNLGIVDR